MSVVCPDQIFDKLWAAAPGHISDPDVMAFAYENISHADFLSAECPELSDLEKAPLRDWSALDEWLYEGSIQVGSWEVTLDDLIEPSADIDGSESVTPLEYFGSKAEFLSKLASVVEEKMEETGNFEFCCLEISSGEKTVTNFYDCSDAWALGHADSVRVSR